VTRETQGAVYAMGVMQSLKERYCAFGNCDVYPSRSEDPDHDCMQSHTHKLNHVAAVNKDEMTED
jgi:hypothetical protein